MEKEFNIFGEFENLEEKYLTSLDDNVTEDDDDLDNIIEAKKKEAEGKSKDDDNDSEEDDKEDSTEEDKPKESKKSSEENSDNEDEEDSSSYSFKALANFLADEGVIDYEDSEEDEDSPELISKAVLTTAQNMLDEYKESLPEEGRKFLSYLEKGGDPKKYLNKDTEFNAIELDLSNEDNQKAVLKEFLKKSDYDEEEIDEILQDYEDGLILEKQAKIAQKKLVKFYEKEKEALLEKQESDLKQRQLEYQKQIDKLSSTIEGSDKLAGLEVSKADKKQLKSYMLDTDKAGVTAWQRDLKEGGLETQLALAYLQMKKFDFSKLAKETETKVTKKYKDIFNGKDNTVKGRSKQIETDKGDFSGFAAFLK